MITSIGADTKMTAAAVKAGMNQFAASEFENLQREAITMAAVPEEVFETLEVEIDEGSYYSELYDRIIKMAIIAAREALAQQPIETPIPLVLAMPEAIPYVNHITPQVLVTNLVNQEDLPIDAEQVRCIHTGRAAGIQALDLAQRYLYDMKQDYVLVGGSDSYMQMPIMSSLDEAGRVMAPGIMDGFIPGEGAGFLLLTRYPDKALNQEGNIIALNTPGISEEPGHLNSDQPYRGDGLSQAFELALKNRNGDPIHSIYSSMNGEHFWAKEYGVAYTRNRASFEDEVQLEHPADCYGDLGVATGPVLIGLAADRLLNQQGAAAHLVYSSSDSACRAALLVEKMRLNINQAGGTQI
jgi:3-oxoacyl-[acyl-carrier-protein] synthase-1